MPARRSGTNWRRLTIVVALSGLAAAIRTPPDRPLTQLGLDSLMGAELMSAVQQRLPCDLPVLEIVNSTSISDLARRCLHRLNRHPAAVPPPPPEPAGSTNGPLPPTPPPTQRR
ncbi:acyl carrier protein [Streptomyces sp. YGL11-2]|uniref:acyl carrier protein n=1 Tax=Streptomyces sp. YGL11-2 TaxID=3414028 RepID=UPI003CF06FF0